MLRKCEKKGGDAVRTDMLKDAMREKGVTVQDVIENLGINQSTFYRKLSRDGGSFTVEQAQKLAELLELDAKRTCCIFFGKELTQTQEEGDNVRFIPGTENG